MVAMPYMPFINVTLLLSLTPKLRQSHDLKLAKLLETLSPTSNSTRANADRAFPSPSIDPPPIPDDGLRIAPPTNLCRRGFDGIFTHARDVSMVLPRRQGYKTRRIRATRDSCKQLCRDNMWFPCAAIDYNEKNQECVLVRDHVNEYIPSYESDLYEKHCVSSRAAAVCLEPYELHLQEDFEAVLYVHRRATVYSLTECIELCAEMKADGKINCKSGVFFRARSSENCWLSDKNEREEPKYRGRPITDDIADVFIMKCD